MSDNFKIYDTGVIRIPIAENKREKPKEMFEKF